MKKSKVLFLYAVMVLFVSADSIAADKRTKCVPKDLPAAITASFNSSYPGLKIKKAYKRMRDGAVSYKVGFNDRKIRRYVTYSPEGKTLKTEEVIDPKSLPEPVRKTINEKYPDCRIKRAQKAFIDNAVVYEIAIRHGKKDRGLVIASEKPGAARERILIDDNGQILPHK